jgi:hypothetical protein
MVLPGREAMPDGLLQVVSQQIEVNLFRTNKPLRNDAARRRHQHDRPRVGANARINVAVFDAVADTVLVFGNDGGVVLLSRLGERRVGQRAGHGSYEGLGCQRVLFGNLDKGGDFRNDVIGRYALASLERNPPEIVLSEIFDYSSEEASVGLELTWTFAPAPAPVPALV